MSKPLAVDINILLRAVFGNGTLKLIEHCGEGIDLFAPDLCLDEARHPIPIIALSRSVSIEKSFSTFESVLRVVESVDASFYQEPELAAKERIWARDPKDWPVVATALLLKCPLWTEDQDFFGCGIATWTNTNVQIYFRPA